MSLVALASFGSHLAVEVRRRLVVLDDASVTFKWKDYRIKGRDRFPSGNGQETPALSTDQRLSNPSQLRSFTRPSGTSAVRKYRSFPASEMNSAGRPEPVRQGLQHEARRRQLSQTGGLKDRTLIADDGSLAEDRAPPRSAWHILSLPHPRAPRTAAIPRIPSACWPRRRREGIPTCLRDFFPRA